MVELYLYSIIRLHGVVLKLNKHRVIFTFIYGQVVVENYLVATDACNIVTQEKGTDISAVTCISGWFFFSMALPAHSGPRPLFQFRNHFSQTVGLLGRVTSPSQGRYLNTGQHKYRINARTDIHALNGIRTHDPSVRAREDSSYLRPRGYCDRHIWLIGVKYVGFITIFILHTNVFTHNFHFN
jgi:hypothetical protein